MPATTEATPADVELVRSFLNTIDYEDGTEVFESPRALAAWLADAGLLTAGHPASGRDLDLALRLRTALRADLDPDGAVGEPAEDLDAVCAELPLRAVAGPEHLVPVHGGVRGALGRILAATVRSRIAGTWSRLKVCPGERCAWVFYDSSRNRSRRWCSMEVCGNRAKVRAFRHRAAEPRSH